MKDLAFLLADAIVKKRVKLAKGLYLISRNNFFELRKDGNPIFMCKGLPAIYDYLNSRYTY